MVELKTNTVVQTYTGTVTVDWTKQLMRSLSVYPKNVSNLKFYFKKKSCSNQNVLHSFYIPPNYLTR